MEAQSTTLADCFLQFIQLAATIKKVSNLRIRGFKNYCIQIFNKRWRNFDAENYLLAYFLHPGFRGAGLRGHQFELIVATAIKIWQQEGYDKSECAHLVAHMRLFYEKNLDLTCLIVLKLILLYYGGKQIIKVLNLLDGLQLSSSQLHLILLTVREPFHH